MQLNVFCSAQNIVYRQEAAVEKSNFYTRITHPSGQETITLEVDSGKPLKKFTRLDTGNKSVQICRTEPQICSNFNYR